MVAKQEVDRAQETADKKERSSCVSGGYNPEFAATLFTESTYMRWLERPKPATTVCHTRV
jgi:hypothetical protein